MLSNEDVAIVVMGWRWSDEWDQIIPPEQKATPGEMWVEVETGKFKHWDEHGEWNSYEPAEGAMVSGYSYSADFTSIRIPDYLNDLDKTKMVLDRLEELDVGILIHKLNYKREYMVRTFDDNRHASWVISENLAEAICQSALNFLK